MRFSKYLLFRFLSLITAVCTVGIFISCNNNNATHQNGDETGAAAPKNLGYSILSVYPHDTSSFTQGLVFYKGELYEGTGEYGRSKVMKVDLKTGKALKQVSLNDKYFGEGITILNDTVYQLTYKEKVVFVYTLPDFKKIKEIPVNTSTGEGWGITHDGKNLIVTDGGNNLHYYEPGTFRLLKKQGVSESGNPLFNLNEVEYIDGYIYANQWQYNYILKIDPSSGIVVAKADLTEVVKRARAKDPAIDFLNGIAYDDTTKKMYITGKYWPELYEIQFSQ